MKKYTKRIQLNNVYNELVTIEPIEYKLAIEVNELMEQQSLLLNKISDLVIKLLNTIGTTQDDEEYKRLNDEFDELHKKETEIRNKYNYWYCGVDNLETKDKEYLLKKYPKKQFN